MADFCAQCSADLGLPPGYSDFDWPGATESVQYCEGCGGIRVNEKGECVSDCLEQHREKHEQH